MPILSASSQVCSEQIIARDLCKVISKMPGMQVFLLQTGWGNLYAAESCYTWKEQLSEACLNTETVVLAVASAENSIASFGVDVLTEIRST